MIEIRDARPEEYSAVGELTVRVYSQLPEMPGPDLMPEYYKLLADVAGRKANEHIRILVAVRESDQAMLGAVTYYDDMRYYGSGGTAPQETNASGIRLLVVDESVRGQGYGRKLTEYCIALSEQAGRSHIILHTTRSMLKAWKLYEAMGFRRAHDLDFMQGPLPVFGFRRKCK